VDIIKILERKFPDSAWELRGHTYSGLTWLSDTPKPKKAELEAHWPVVQEEIAAEAQAKADARASGLAKLEALGLTVEEVSTVFGIEV